MQENISEEQQKDNLFIFYQRVTVFFLLSISILLIYSNTFQASWLLDDKQNILENQKIHLEDLSLNSLKKTFYAQPEKKNSNQGNINEDKEKLYRPIPMLTFALNWYFGQKNVTGYHAVNLIIHVIAVFFLYLTFLTIFKTPILYYEKYADKNNVHFIALLAALLWGMHPIQIQAVTHIVQRMASMAGMFYILGIYLYLKARLSRNRMMSIIWFCTVLIVFCLALASKQNSAMLPFSLILVEVIFFQTFSYMIRDKFSSLFVWILSLSMIVAGAFIFLKLDPLNLLKGYEIRNFTLLERVLTEPRILWFYISQIFYPVADRFSIDHYFQISRSFFDPLSTVFAIIFIISIIILALIYYRKYPIISFAALFFFLNHIIESTIIPLELVFEHRNYIPSFFLFLPIAIFVEFILSFYKGNKKMFVIFFLFFTFLIIFTGFATYTRNLVWRSKYAMWNDAVEKSPEHARPHQNLALCFAKIHNENKVIELNKKALFLKDSKPKYAKFISYFNIGISNAKLDQNDKAIKYFKKALRLDPNGERVNENLATLFLKNGDLDKAKKYIDTLISPEKTSKEKFFWLKAVLLLHKGELEQSKEYGLKALKNNPVEEKALLITGVCFSLMGKSKKGERLLKNAYTLYPGSIVTNFVLLETLIKQLKFDKADDVAKNIVKRFTVDHIFNKLDETSKQFVYPPISKKIISEHIFKILKQYETGLYKKGWE